jgi:mannitol/fructose-specific phosphotransferase system IIA component (Ntr-type)
VAVSLLDILSPECVRAPLEGTTKREVIDELCELVAAREGICDLEALRTTVWEREDQRSTGIGEGLAIPHGKCESVNELAMAIGRPQEPLEFGSIDGNPVRLVILLASPADRIAEHIQALGKISRVMTDPEVRERAYTAESADELYQLFADHITS